MIKIKTEDSYFNGVFAGKSDVYCTGNICK